MKANRLVLLAVAGTSVLALSGCSQTGNVAARVGDETVPTSDVDFVTRMQCVSINKAAKDPAQAAQGGVQAVPTSQIRSSTVNTLVQIEIDRQLARKEHVSYDKAQLRDAMSQFESAVKQVPKKDQDRYRDFVESYYRGQLQVFTLAQSQLADQGVSKPTQDQVQQAMTAIETKFRKSVDVKVNPQYGADADGVAGAVDPSLSVAVSSFAKSARAATADPVWVAKLPVDQRCG